MQTRKKSHILVVPSPKYNVLILSPDEFPNKNICTAERPLPDDLLLNATCSLEIGFIYICRVFHDRESATLQLVLKGYTCNPGFRLTFHISFYSRNLT